MTPLTLVYAVGYGGEFGLEGGMPWDEPEDRAHFREVTAGHALIMGRKTFESMGHVVYADRFPIVVGGRRRIGAPLTVPTFEEALDLAYAHDPAPCVIGGRALLEQAWWLATRIERTLVRYARPADVVFPYEPGEGEMRQFQGVPERTIGRFCGMRLTAEKLVWGPPDEARPPVPRLRFQTFEIDPRDANRPSRPFSPDDGFSSVTWLRRPPAP